MWSALTFSNLLILVAMYYLYVILSSFYGLFVPTPCPSAKHPAPCVDPMVWAGHYMDVYAYLQLGELAPVSIWNVHSAHSRNLLWAGKNLSTTDDFTANISVGAALQAAKWSPAHGKALSVHVLVVHAGGNPRQPLAADAAQLTQWMEISQANTTNLLTGVAENEPEEPPGSVLEHTFWSGKLGVVLEKGDEGVGANVGKVTGTKVPKALQGLQVYALDDRVVAEQPFEAITAAIKASSRPLKMRFKPHEIVKPEVTPGHYEWHWMPQLNILLSTDATPHSIQRPPDGLHLTYDKGKYMPFFTVDTFSVLSTDFMPLSTLQKDPPEHLTVAFRPTSIGEFRLLKSFDASTKMLVKDFGFSNKDIDDVKQIVTRTSLWMLSLTYFVLFMHMLFDFLAFKNDIGFWRKRDNMEGLSSRSVVGNFVCNIIIFIHLYDSGFTSIIVLLSAGVSTLIEAWKVIKVLKVRFTFTGFSLSVSRESRNEAEVATDAFDATAVNMMGTCLYPMVVGGAAYSLVYMQHRSVLSWLISSAANGVYTMGFVLMTPQLFINYKLKSVAHLPWKAFMYKAFNTFIDDIFSFIITMPTSHRIACFRDDIVFFVYLYQRWLYPVDKARVNEFGMSGDDED